MQERSALETRLAAAEITVNAGRARVGVRSSGSTQAQGQRCTDALCCLIFLLSIAATVGLGALGAKFGHPEVLVRFAIGRDFTGRLCGIDEGVKDFKLTYFTLHEGHAPVAPGNWTDKTRSQLRAVCTSKCPQEVAGSANASVSAREADLCPPDMSPDWCTWYGSRTERFANYCVDSKIFSMGDQWGHSLQDVHAAAPIITVAPIIALVVGFLYLGFVHRCGGMFIWASIILSGLLPAVVGFVFFESSKEGFSDKVINNELKDISLDRRKEIAYALWLVSVIFLAIGCCSSRTINNVVDVLRATSQFLTDVPSQMLQPVFMGVMQLFVVGMWLVCFVLVASIGAKEGDQSKCLAVGDIDCLKWDVHTQTYGLLFLLVELYWLLNFLHALSHFATSYAVHQWYMASEDPLTGKKAPSAGGHTLCDCRLTVRGLCRGLVRHPGSLAFGAFVISLCQIFRILFWFARRDLESVPQNPAAACLRRCTDCIADCVTMFIEYVSEHAYVEVAITGVGFMRSAQKATSMTVNHPALFALVTRVACAVRFFGVIITTGTAVAACFALLLALPPMTLTSVKAPLFMAGLGAFVVGEVMMHPFTVAARGSLHCLCYDRDHMNAPQGIIRLVEEHSVAEEPRRGCCCS